MEKVNELIKSGAILIHAEFVDHDTLMLGFDDGAVLTVTPFFDPDEDRAKLNVEVD